MCRGGADEAMASSCEVVLLRKNKCVQSMGKMNAAVTLLVVIRLKDLSTLLKFMITIQCSQQAASLQCMHTELHD